MFINRSTRIPANYEAEIVLDRERLDTVIEDFSETGMKLRVMLKIMHNISPGTQFRVEFPLLSSETLTPLEEKLKIPCKVIWAEKDLSDYSSNVLGAQIIEITPEYEEFFKIIYSNYMGMP
jgi:c-di-GMP-binding flagellar brake protein YcgR